MERKPLYLLNHSKKKYSVLYQQKTRSNFAVATTYRPMEQAKEVSGDPRGSQCTSNFPSPTPCHHASLIKKAIKLPSHRYLPAPNVLFSPSFLHFRPDFSFLPTFSGHFSLMPILVLSTLYGHSEGCTDNRILPGVPYRTR